MAKLFVSDFSDELPKSKEVEKIEIFKEGKFLGEIVSTEEGIKIEANPELLVEISTLIPLSNQYRRNQEE
ncbi:MAG: hypothetical protein DRH33_03195 [Candidatus Nealsonbacteria bacterium]|nr:MAG: hypothetical protein DRH33_03195 [Candidatus Nealsonbacteria bacterium]